jgi:hypothetical protein
MQEAARVGDVVTTVCDLLEATERGLRVHSV